MREWIIGKAGDDVKELTIDAVIGNMEAVTDYINAWLEEVECPVKAQMQIDIAVDEIFSNIARYAYAPEIGEAVIRLETESDPRAAVITFMDRGKAYDPLELKEPVTTLSAEERPIGGLGIFLVKKIMDDVEYAYRNGQNILRIRKKI